MMNRLRVQPRVEVKAAPQASLGLKMLARMLPLSQEELQKLIEQELEENPALEASEEERVRIFTSTPTLISLDADSPNPGDESDLEDWLEARLATPPMDLKDHVLGQLRLMVAPERWHIAEHLVESLDSRGYLPVEVEDVALYLNVALEEVEEVIGLLHKCDPPGVGARTLQECLLLQLDSLQDIPDSYEPDILEWTYTVVRDGFDEFARGHWEKLQRKLRLSEDALHEVKRFIRNELRPYPAGEMEPKEPLSDQGAPLEPDIIVRASQNGLHIEIRGAPSESLRLSPAYLEQSTRLNKGNLRYSEHEREHIQHYLTRARIFLQALQQRYQTLKRITEVIAQRQLGFLMTSDARFLQPMTRVEVAAATGLHRSTVGRAVRNKWLQLPSGKMVQLDVFFDASYRTALLIEQILEAHEGAGKRLTDAEIAEKLAEMGIEVARRTVAKYRQRHNILSSHWRERQRLVG
jgi:RNA polymerase sigma-54 factor